MYFLNKLIISLLVGSLMISGCSQDPTDPKAVPTGTISGKVTGNLEHFTLGLWINVYPYDNGKIGNATVSSVQVNSNGSYSMKVPSGTFVCSLYSKGVGFSNFYYNNICNMPYSTVTIVARDKETLAEVRKTSIECGPTPVSINDQSQVTIDFNLNIFGTITGYVRDNQNLPISNIPVYADGFNGNWSVTNSMSDGSYTLTCLLPGQYTVSVDTSQNDYIQPYYNYQNLSTFFEKDATPLSIQAGKINPDINFILEKGREISGNIRIEETNTAAVGIIVRAIHVGTGLELEQSEKTGADGAYKIKRLPSGIYKLIISGYESNNQKYPTQYYDQRYTLQTAREVDLQTLGQASGKDIYIQSYGGISGTVKKSSDDQPLENMTVRAFNASYSATASTNANGSYTITGLPAGNYRIEVRTLGTDYAPKYYDDKLTYDLATLVDVRFGEITQNRNFYLTAGSNIKGQVRDEDKINTFISGITVTAFDTDERRGWDISAKSDQSGAFQLKGLADGSYKLYANALGTLYISEYFDNKTLKEDAQSFDVIFGQSIQSVIFRLLEGGKIEGEVRRDSDNTLLEKVLICATSSNNQTYTALTRENGTYTITGLPESSYTVYANTAGTIYTSEYFNDTYDPDLVERVPVVRLLSKKQINFSLSLYGRITGAITCLSGASVPYALENMPPGTFRIEAQMINPTAGPMVFYYFNTTNANSAKDVILEPETTLSDINFVLKQ